MDSKARNPETRNCDDDFALELACIESLLRGSVRVAVMSCIPTKESRPWSTTGGSFKPVSCPQSSAKVAMIGWAYAFATGLEIPLCNTQLQNMTVSYNMRMFLANCSLVSPTKYQQTFGIPSKVFPCTKEMG